MATQAQLDEKRQPEASASSSGPLESVATPAQLREKARQDQAWGSSSLEGFASPAQLDEKARGRAPPLPPRTSSTPAPPPYSSDDAKRSELISEQWRSHDPRSSSTHSLVPSESGRDGRRTLLMVFIHGFMGNEASFQSFPAHVHNLLTITLAETHVVHTKLYPRYKSRKVIEFARDDFSNWLEPHENHNTDVVLLGHSMGGILAADVALQKPMSPATGKPFRHRILGTISFDTPFLGMHPGVVVSGIGSLFRPAPDLPSTKPAQASTSGTNTPMGSQGSPAPSSYTPSTVGTESSSLSLVQSITSPLGRPPLDDPYFNPPFPNDVQLRERTGWSSVLHFINKHSDGLTSATTQYFKSHIEFGGCLADYPGLLDRYEKIRALEDVDDLARPNGPGYRPPTRRIRFVNYYTASTGRPKPQKIPPGHMEDKNGYLKPIEVEMQDMGPKAPSSHSPTPTPSISVEDHSDGVITPQQLEEGPSASPVEVQMQNLGENSGVQDDFQESPEMKHIDSIPMEDDDQFPEPKSYKPDSSFESKDNEIEPTRAEPELPPIPALPTEPESIDLDKYTDKDSRKIAEKEQKRIMKVYQQAIKDRESAIKDRKKLVEKREKNLQKEREKKLKAEEKQRLKEEKEEEKRKGKEEEKRKASTSSISESTKSNEVLASSTPTKADKPKKDKKFCMLPPQSAGKRDKCWVRIYMEGVDEVGAHCGLFFPGAQYESLVMDVGERVGKWVQEDAVRRARLGVEQI